MRLSTFGRLAAVIIFLSTIIVGCGSEQSRQEPAPDTTAQVAKDSLVIELVGEDSVSVLDLLKRDRLVEYRSTAAGAFVTAIDSTANSAEYFWLFSINDTFPTVACDRCVVSSADRVTWHYRRVGR